MNHKGFTLTELLVIVVMIGVLGAVVLPKFTKTLAMRKISEAQEMMSAVRTEQEARCTLGKNYVALDQLQAFRQGKHFTYHINDQKVGMVAQPKQADYILEMPSYADGRICCSKGCADINRSYPTCSELEAKADYVQPNARCEAYEEFLPPSIPPEQPEEPEVPQPPVDPTTPCAQGTVEIDGLCCLPGQKVKDGKCLYQYTPQTFDLQILTICSSSSAREYLMPPLLSEAQFNSGEYPSEQAQYGTYANYVNSMHQRYSGSDGYMGADPGRCPAIGYAYFHAGEPHLVQGPKKGYTGWHVLGQSGWDRGERVTGELSPQQTQQDWCDEQCGSQPSCDKKVIVNKGNPIDNCHAYTTQAVGYNQWFCSDESATSYTTAAGPASGGTGIGLQCYRVP